MSAEGEVMERYAKVLGLTGLLCLLIGWHTYLPHVLGVKTKAD